MNLVLINQSLVRMPRSFINTSFTFIEMELLKTKVYNLEKKIYLKNKELVIIFLNPKPAQNLNLKFRNKNYPTDILSFDGDSSLNYNYFGELILCPQVILRQAKEHGLSFRLELIYILIHGVLHLLGYEHENSIKEAEIMFKLQDKIFDHFLEGKYGKKN